ncbi:MAG: SAM-dependent methyltransferase [Planctomycetes bacterium]|nr:SAM-dependent methyltransferase [Planctomycetota bacterium]
MTPSFPDYELLDFGEGRKLEQFGPWVLDRPCPGAVEISPAKPQAWGDATACYRGDRAGDGVWSPVARRWEVTDFDLVVGGGLGMTLQLAPLPSGQVGVFPEQLANWRWIAEQTARAATSLKPKVLNLFAYTGGSTLAAARAGAEVTHVDAAKSVVDRARGNAAASGLANAPIRWIVEDALKFCQREVKRGNQYDAIILDPPSYGHGPKGQPWSIGRDLLPLLNLCGELTAKRRAFVLCTCHTSSIGPAELSAYLSEGLFGHCGQPPEVGRLYLTTSDGRKLPSGCLLDGLLRWLGLVASGDLLDRGYFLSDRGYFFDENEI